MLVHIARGSTELRKLGIERGVFRDIEGKFSVDFEPLGTFTPLGDVDLRCHIVVIASPPNGPGSSNTPMKLCLDSVM